MGEGALQALLEGPEFEATGVSRLDWLSAAVNEFSEYLNGCRNPAIDPLADYKALREAQSLVEDLKSIYQQVKGETDGE